MYSNKYCAVTDLKNSRHQRSRQEDVFTFDFHHYACGILKLKILGDLFCDMYIPHSFKCAGTLLILLIGH